MLQVIVKLFSAQHFDGGVLKVFVFKVLSGMELYVENYLRLKTWTHLREYYVRKQTTSRNNFFIN